MSEPVSVPVWNQVRTKRCLIIPIRDTDADRLILLFQSEKLMRHYDNGHTWTRDHFMQRSTPWIKRSEAGRPSWYTIRRLAPHQQHIIGTIGYNLFKKEIKHYNKEFQEMEVALIIASDYQNFGYAVEALYGTLRQFRDAGIFNRPPEDSIFLYGTISTENTAGTSLAASLSDFVEQSDVVDEKRFEKPRKIYYVVLNRDNVEEKLHLLEGKYEQIVREKGAEVINILYFAHDIEPDFCGHQGESGGRRHFQVQKNAFPTHSRYEMIATINFLQTPDRYDYWVAILYGVQHGQYQVVGLRAPQGQKYVQTGFCTTSRDIKWKLVNRQSYSQYVLCVRTFSHGIFNPETFRSAEALMGWVHVTFVDGEIYKEAPVPQLSLKKNKTFNPPKRSRNRKAMRNREDGFHFDMHTFYSSPPLPTTPDEQLANVGCTSDETSGASLPPRQQSNDETDANIWELISSILQSPNTETPNTENAVSLPPNI